MVKYFTNFVKYGNPTPPGLSENLTKWETYATEKVNFEIFLTNILGGITKLL
jgi:hypothetical protein